MNITKKYYQDNSKEFFDSTICADVSSLYDHFLKYVPMKGYILDLGCGSGRDTKAFMNRGFCVDAIDGSEELCELASEYTGISVRCMDFSELSVKEKYDAVWSCASLLHVESKVLREILAKVRYSLRDGGVLYMSFKYGDYEGERDGRYFNDMNEEKFDKSFGTMKDWIIVEKWISEDVRREKNNQWFNVILRKEECVKSFL